MSPIPVKAKSLSRANWLSIDPYVRALLNDSETPSEWMMQIGGVIDAGIVGEVLVSRDEPFGVAERVVVDGGWQDFAAARAVDARPSI